MSCLQRKYVAIFLQDRIAIGNHLILFETKDLLSEEILEGSQT
jgi:hypothetical protein